MIDALVAAGREHRLTLTSQSTSALQAAVENGLGVGVVPPELIRPRTMRTLVPSKDIPAALTVQYGLYAQDRRTAVTNAGIEALLHGIPSSSAQAERRKLEVS